MSSTNKGFLQRIAAMHMPGREHVPSIVPDAMPVFNYGDSNEQSQIEPRHMFRFQRDNEQDHKTNAVSEYTVAENPAHTHLESASFAFLNTDKPDNFKGSDLNKDQDLRQVTHDLSEINSRNTTQRTSDSLSKNLTRHADNRKQSLLQPKHEPRLRASEHKSVETNSNESAQLNQASIDRDLSQSKRLPDNSKRREMHGHSLRPVSATRKQSQASLSRLDSSLLRTEQEPVINITIGQIDIRAEQEVSAGSSLVKKKAKPQTDKLEAYYQKRMRRPS